MQCQVSNFAVGDGQAEHVLQVFRDALRNVEQVRIFAHNVFAHWVAQLNAVTETIQRRPNVNEQRPLQFVALRKVHAGDFLEFADQSLDYTVNRLVGFVLENFIGRHGQPRAQKVQAQVNLFVFAQFGEMFPHELKFTRRKNFFALQADEVQFVRRIPHNRQQRRQAVQIPFDVINFELRLDFGQALEVSVNLVAIEERQLPVFKQSPQRVEEQEIQRAHVNDVARDFVAGFGRVGEFGVVLVQLPNQNLNVAENRIAADNASLHEPVDVDGRFALDDVARDNFGAFAGRENVFVAVVLFVGERVDCDSFGGRNAKFCCNVRPSC